jgi:hypothetical protein
MFSTQSNSTLRHQRHLRLPLLILLASLATSSAEAADLVRHNLTVKLDTKTHHLAVTDRIELPENLAHPGVEFLLNANLKVDLGGAGLTALPLGESEDFFGINGTSVELQDQVALARYRIDSIPVGGAIEVSYAGTVDYALSEPKEEYTRGFRSTAGIVGEEGVYLAGSGFWYPYFDDNLIEFQLQVEVPEGWHLISQGNGTSHDENAQAHWDSLGPMDEIYLVGGPLLAYHESAGAVRTSVYLHEPDEALASKYLSTTAQYLEMYRSLIGPYPYGKFALVENFWDTGYGMPSFTLLGPRIIRFPFILHSSYPHEILHNWWGNSVFVDYPTGNWCEGLTAYLADHLVQEQRGKGSDYRRAALQKYRNYVKEERDFPLAEFRSRHSAATEAVGYGKTLMGFHMLRRHLGDEDFSKALARFFRSAKGQRASFQDIQETFQKVSGEDLSWFFEPWVQRAGAAELGIEIQSIEEMPEGYVTRGALTQVQSSDPFPLEVPIVVQTAETTEQSIVRLVDRKTEFEVKTSELPLALHIDPAFDLFRKLDPRETPPSIGQLFGEPEILAIIPSQTTDVEAAAYRDLLQGWQSDSHSIEILVDTDVDMLPADRAVWILGRENRYAGKILEVDGSPLLQSGSNELSLGGEAVPLEEHSLVVVRRHPGNLEKVVGWIAVEPSEAFPGLGRKLPHYGKYSYLAFEGNDPTNVVKGQWATQDSPLSVDLREDGKRTDPLLPLQLEKRSALAELPPVFSQKALLEHIDYLASPELEGRGVGSSGLEQAAAYIAEAFEKFGLAPAGDDGTYYQRLTIEDGPGGQQQEATNVIGYLPGKRTDWQAQSTVVSAHYDHLGHGWPDVRQGNEGKIHPGADDNASGVAVLLELAKNFATAEPPQRNLVFVAFSAEEAGRLGSKYFLEHPTQFPIEGMRGVVNLDTVGRLADQKVSVLGTGTTEEWQHIFRGSSFVTGVESRNVAEAAGGSDQMSFIEKGIPGVQIFTQAHTDYHTPTDTVEKIDGPGLVKIATFVKEAVSYLVEREEPLTITIAVADEPSSGAPVAPQRNSGGRKVRFGTIPEFSFAGPGVQVAGVVPDSPAAKAGLLESDVITQFNGEPVADLQQYSDVLKSLEPGQQVSVILLREGKELTVTTTVEAR